MYMTYANVRIHPSLLVGSERNSDVKSLVMLPLAKFSNIHTARTRTRIYMYVYIAHLYIHVHGSLQSSMSSVMILLAVLRFVYFVLELMDLRNLEIILI